MRLRAERYAASGKSFVLRVATIVISLAAIALTVFLTRNGSTSSRAKTEVTSVNHETLVSPPDLGSPLFPPVAFAQPPNCQPTALVIPDCRLTVIDKQEVPSQRDGVLLFVGSEIEPGETVPPDQVITVRLDGKEQRIRRVKEGDVVRPGQLLAYLDDRLQRDECAIKKARITSSQADLEAAIKTCDENRNRYETQLRLRQEGRGVTSEEDFRGSRLAYDRAVYEVQSKREAVTLAEREWHQAETVLRMHQLRSATPGIVQTIRKRPGEAVKALEPVVQIHHLARLRAEGLVDLQHLSRLKVGMPVQVVPSPPESPRQTLAGFMKEITSVDVGQNPEGPVFVAASSDGTVRVWNRRGDARILHHPAPVLAVAARGSLCVTGSADGVARLWNLTATGERPVGELTGQHQGAVTSVAISPDGKFCATGGEDRIICLWETATGTLRYRFPEGHRGAVTRLQFTPQSRLISAGRDNSLRVWVLGKNGARQENCFENRSGQVVSPGVSVDGCRMIYDQGNTLRFLIPDGTHVGTVASSSPAPFTTFALFSPDARLLLTAGPAEGQVQLWQTPTATAPALPVRQLVLPEAAGPTCAAFAPDGSFLVVGARDRSVRVWDVSGLNDTSPRVGEIALIDRAVESSNHQVRVWVELPNPDGRLLPGTTVQVVVPEGK